MTPSRDTEASYSRPQVSEEHYFCHGYDTRERWMSYWHQIAKIRELNPNSVLEVGVGNRLVADYLGLRGFDITTMDIDPRLGPDVAATVLSIPFRESSFEVVALYEVLEHIPYQLVSKALEEVRRVTRRSVVLSIPDCTEVVRVGLTIPRLATIRKLVPLPLVDPPPHEFDGEHYWEVGKAGFPLSRITKTLERSGFRIRKTTRTFENPYHRFFTLEKDGG